MKQVSRCPPFRYRAELSSLAMSGLAFSVAPRKRRKTPLRHLVIAQTHTDLIDLHRRVRDQSQPPIQYWLWI